MRSFSTFSTSSLLNQKKKIKRIRRWKHSFWIWILSCHGKIFLFCWKWRIDEEQVFFLKHERPNWCMDEIVHFHYLLNSDHCSFNVIFTITKGIVTSITCTLFHRRKMSMFLDGCHSENLCDECGKCTVPGHWQTESSIWITTSTGIIVRDVAGFLWGPDTEVMLSIRNWWIMDPTLQTTVSSLGFQTILWEWWGKIQTHMTIVLGRKKAQTFKRTLKLRISRSWEIY